MIRRAGVLSLTLLSTGCYTYQDLAPGPSVATGSIVRLELTDGGTADAAKTIGPYVVTLEGPVQAADQEGITVSVTSLRRRGEGDTQWNGESVNIGRGGIRFLRQRTSSRGRTALALGAFTALGVGLVVAIAKAVGVSATSSPVRPHPPGS
ncbi:MAG: hypothetical protein ABIT38_18060 [Gemmatimonadaceae bacterium]